MKSHCIVGNAGQSGPVAVLISGSLLCCFTHIFYCSHVRFVPRLDLYHKVVLHVLILEKKEEKKKSLLNLFFLAGTMISG